MEIKNNIINYISNLGISVDKISEDTGIDKEKIVKESQEDINATEFLMLCEYLKVNPRSFYSSCKDYNNVK